VNRKPDLTVALPIGSGYGWGNCGKYFTSHLNDHFNVKYVCLNGMKKEEAVRIFDEAKLALPDNIVEWDFSQPYQCVHPVLTCMADATMAPIAPIRGQKTMGIFFCEDFPFAHDWIKFRYHNPWDLYLAGSEWNRFNCMSIPSSLAIQGVDERVFFPNRNIPADQPFTVFSGGKFEYRKGQDIVLAAFANFLKRVPNAQLIAAWHNPWTATQASMEQSRFIRFNLPSENGMGWMMAAGELGIPRGSIKLYARQQKPEALAALMNSSHLGVFPNRCEGGTNLVLMEAISTGLPVIASVSTGQSAIASNSNYCQGLSTLPGMMNRPVSSFAFGSDTDETYPDDLCEAMYAHYCTYGTDPVTQEHDFISKFNWATRSQVLAENIKQFLKL
jgi:glycosyltransferase involved in cell wall biosynthesis